MSGYRPSEDEVVLATFRVRYREMDAGAAVFEMTTPDLTWVPVSAAVSVASAEVEIPRALGAVVYGVGISDGMKRFVSVDADGEQWIEVGDADSGYVRRGDLTAYEVLGPGIEVPA